MEQPKYSVNAGLSRDRRSQCYKLADNVEKIHEWYIALPIESRQDWTTPEAIVKHAPKHLVEGKLKGDNKPPRSPKDEKKRSVSAREDRLIALLIQVITRLAKYEPDAMKLLEEITPAGEFNDSLDDVSGGEGSSPEGVP